MDLELLLEKANNNDIDSLMNLGYAYFYGNEVDENKIKAIEYFEKAESLGCIEATIEIAYLYLHGDREDLKQVAFEKFSNACKKGCYDAFCGIIEYYQDEDEESADKMFFNFVKGIVEENPDNHEALLQLALAYLDGTGIARDCDIALELLEKAIALNSINAMDILGGLLIDGEDDFPHDVDRAIELFINSASGGNVSAMFNLAMIFSDGKYIEPDKEKSMYYLNLAKDNNYPPAYRLFGIWYEFGEDDVSKDIDKAIEYYQAAAEFDDAYSNYRLGELFKDINSEYYDVNKAVEHLKKACEAEYPDAYFSLGSLYYFGIENHTMEEAIELYTIGANNGSGLAQTALAVHYFETGDRYKAAKYFEMAAEQGSVNAMYRLADMFLFGLGVEKDFLKAFKYAQMASDAGNMDAKLLLARMYDTGEGTLKNTNRAMELYWEIYRSDSPLKENYFVVFSIAQDYHGKKQFDLAFPLWMKLAEQGDNFSQYLVGEYYALRRGINKTFKGDELQNATYWIKKSIENGYDDPKAYKVLEKISQQYNNLTYQQKTGKKCYVATAVYGSYDCPPVWVLRRYRDEVLEQSWQGRLFIKVYYYISPKFIKLFGDKRWFNHFFKNILDRKVIKLKSHGFKDTAYYD